MKRMGIVGVAAVVALRVIGSANAQEEPVPNLADVMQQVMGAMGQATGASTNAEPYEPVGFRILKDQLPDELTGMRRTSASGEKTSTFGMTMSMAEARYEGENNEWLSLTISDIGALGGFAAMAEYAWTMSEYERESDTGFERTTTWNGHRAVEEFDNRSQRGKISLMLENKIVIDIESNDVPYERLEEARDALDVDAMLGLREQAEEEAAEEPVTE